MQKNTKKHGLFGSVVSTIMVVGWMLLMLSCIIELVMSLTGILSADWRVLAMIGGQVLILCAIIGGVCYALYQRWREIQGGEEDEAKKY